MIAYITGKITEHRPPAVIVEAGGIGYEVTVTSSDIAKFKIDETTTIQIYEHIREDAHVLYGFGDSSSRAQFVQLLGISGIGPKVAMAIMSAAGTDKLQSAISSGDPTLLSAVAGVGTKTAQRIVVELKGKLDPTKPQVATDPAYQALVGLGYTGAVAAEAVANLPSDITGEQERIKLALKGVKR